MSSFFNVSAFVVDHLLAAEAAGSKLTTVDLGQALSKHFGLKVQAQLGFDRLSDLIRRMPELDVVLDDNDGSHRVVSLSRTSN